MPGPIGPLVDANLVPLGTTGNPLVTTSAGTVDQDVNLVGINGAAPVVGHGVAAAALRVELPTDGTGKVGLNAGSALIGSVGIDQTTPGTTNAVAVTGLAVTPTDRSGTVTAGGTAQNAAASNASRKGFWIQNNSSGPLTVSTIGTASTTAGLIIQPGQLWEMPTSGVSTGAVSVLGATTGQRFDAREW